jgi:hypothetical protein
MAYFNVTFTVTLACTTEIEAYTIEDAEAIAEQYDWQLGDIGNEEMSIDTIHEVE